MNSRSSFTLKIKEPTLLPNIWSILSIALIFVVFFICNFQMLLCPGVSIDIPSGHNISYTHNDCILTVQSEDFLILESDFLSMQSLQGGFEKFIENNPQNNKNLLIRMDKTIPIEKVIKICDAAKSAGFENIQIATNKHNAQ